MAERVLRCAIYTRKSTEDGLDQEFNSLDAQYEACAAYALSQRHEGWVLVPERYDDGGFSGGNMQRPGLKRLLDAVAAKKIDIILLYKIDRLTRSLADFAKIVEVLDQAGASFVSITQSFNTTTSMGRLTLNMLLSFAQFEREVTSERIRDKIAASKRKGMWMGGPVPLGYRVLERKLVVDESEAELVRHIMRSYLVVGSVVELAEQLNREGYRTKVQSRASGPQRGGCPFRRGTLFHLLSNQVYLGKIIHKKQYFEGEHEPIVPLALWTEVQAALAERSSGPSRRLRAAHPSLLVGMLVDGEGRAMTPSHATKPGKRYRYYVTRPEQLDGSPAWRVSAHDIESLVCNRIAVLLCDQQFLSELTRIDAEPSRSLQRAIAEGKVAASALRGDWAQAKVALLRAMVERIEIHSDALTIILDRSDLRKALLLSEIEDAGQSPITLSCEVAKVRKGHQVRLIIPSGRQAAEPPAARDDKLVALLAEAHATRKLLLANPDRSISQLAAEAGRCRSRMTKLVPLACLAPDIISAIIEGRQPQSLTSRSLLATEIPIGWSEQRTALGFC
ncbi:MAG: recombinase family protein [Sphingomicrobium sp.]